jgi:hypothetical protein
VLSWTGRFRNGQLDIERERDLARDLVLELEQIARVAIEAFGPEMRVCLGIDQLGVDANPAARSPDAPLQHIADA